MPWNASYTNINFRIARADGAAIWLNGQLTYRLNLAAPLTYTNLAQTVMTGFTSQVYYSLARIMSPLPRGTNLLAVEVHQSSITNSTLAFDMEFIATGALALPPSLSIGQEEGNIVLTWPLTNGSGFTLYSTTNLVGSATWNAISAAETNGSQLVVTQSLDPRPRFFRLQRSE